MKEITRIITAEITMIETMPDNDAEAVVSCKEEACFSYLCIDLQSI